MNKRSWLSLFLSSVLFISLSSISSVYAVISSVEEISSKYELVGLISSSVVVLKDLQTGASLTRRVGEPLSQELKISKIDAKSITLTSSILGEDFVLNFDKFGTTVAANTPDTTTTKPLPVTPGINPAPQANPGSDLSIPPTNPSTQPQTADLNNPYDYSNYGPQPLNPQSDSSSLQNYPQDPSLAQDPTMVPPPTTIQDPSLMQDPMMPQEAMNPSNPSDVAQAEQNPPVSELSDETLNLLDRFYENPDSFTTEQIQDLERRLLEGM